MKRRTVAIRFVMAFVIVIFTCLALMPHFQAITWHLIHGRELSWDSHTLTLPFTWRPVSTRNNTALTLAKAKIPGPDAELRVTRSGTALQSIVEASDWQRDSLRAINSKTSTIGQYKTYTVVSTAGDAFCIASGTDDIAVSFVCRVVGTDWEIRFLGVEADVQDARGVVASLR